jgi:hypothetical protein
MPGDASNTELLQQLAGLGLVGLSAGAGVRSIMGIRDWMHRLRERPNPYAPAVIRVVSPPEEEEEDSLRPARLKAANPTAPAAAPQMDPTWMDWLLGRTTDKAWAKPWFMTAAIGAPMLGLAAGYRGVDNLMDSVTKRQRQSELDSAKEDYRKALLQQFYSEKAGSADDPACELGRDLTELYGRYKEAGETRDLLRWMGNTAGTGIRNTVGAIGEGLGLPTPQTLSEAAGAVTGAYAPVGLGIAGLSGYLAYNWARGRQPDKRLADAIKARARARLASRPAEIYAIEMPAGKEVPDVKEEEILKESKAVGQLYR